MVLSDGAGFNAQVGRAEMAMITSANNSEWPLDVEIADLDSAGLSSAALVRMKLFTLDERLVMRKAGQLALRAIATGSLSRCADCCRRQQNKRLFFYSKSANRRASWCRNSGAAFNFSELNQESKLEEEILASFERDEWRSVPNLTEEIVHYALIASASLAKDKRVNIRISARGPEGIQAKAAEEGIPIRH